MSDYIRNVNTFTSKEHGRYAERCSTPSMKAASSVYPPNGKMWATYWSGCTTTMQPLSRSIPRISRYRRRFSGRGRTSSRSHEARSGPSGQKRRRHNFDCRFVMALLEYRPDIDHAFDVCTVRGAGMHRDTIAAISRSRSTTLRSSHVTSLPAFSSATSEVLSAAINLSRSFTAAHTA